MAAHRLCKLHQPATHSMSMKTLNMHLHSVLWWPWHSSTSKSSSRIRREPRWVQRMWFRPNLNVNTMVCKHTLVFHPALLVQQGRVYKCQGVPNKALFGLIHCMCTFPPSTCFIRRSCCILHFKMPGINVTHWLCSLHLVPVCVL